jgi:hypothetical protein
MCHEALLLVNTMDVLAEARNVKMAMIEGSEGFEGGKDLG